MAEPELCENRKTVHIGHDKIEKYERELVSAGPIEQIERRLSARRRHGRHARARDRRFEQSALHRIVVYNQNGLCHERPLATMLAPEW
jgi:hypothetical protein